MIHAYVDNPDHRKIMGFEIGTRKEFDSRHGDEDRWFFIDSFRVKFRADISHFLRYPTMYRIDASGDIYISNDAPVIDPSEIPNPPFGYVALRGRDGKFLRGEDGSFLYGYIEGYQPPPAGYVYIIDPDGFILKDPDGYFLIEASNLAGPSTVYLIDTDEAYLTDVDGSKLTE